MDRGAGASYRVPHLDAAGRLVGVARVPHQLVGGSVFLIENPNITLIPGTLQRITVAPTTRTIAVGSSTNFTATGDFSDGSSRDLTSTSTWTSSAPTVATVSGGQAQALQAGTSTLTASFGNVSGTATLTVSETPATVASIQVEPALDGDLPLVGLNETLNLKATATLSDDTERDVTEDAQWTSSNDLVATVDGGQVTGIGEGEANVTATLGAISGSLEVGVETPPALLFQAGQVYSLNTTSGTIVPAIGGSATVPGWNAAEQRLQLTSFAMPAGTVLNVTGEVALQVHATGDITLDGVIDVSGQDGADGEDGVDGGYGVDGTSQGGEDGGDGLDVSFFARRNLGGSGQVISAGGHGGDGGALPSDRNASASLVAGDGGDGGRPGEVVFQAGGQLSEPVTTLLGGDGGAGGSVTVADANDSHEDGGTASAIGGAGGDGGGPGGAGGAGGSVSSGSSIGAFADNSTASMTGGAGGAGGDGAPGGAGGSVSAREVRSTATDAAAFARAGAGGAGGAGAPGGAGGGVFVSNECTAEGQNSTAIVTAGNGGAGGAGAEGGAGGEVSAGSYVWASAANCATRVSGGQGGAGGSGAAGGAGGEARIGGDLLCENSSLAVVTGGRRRRRRQQRRRRGGWRRFGGRRRRRIRTPRRPRREQPCGRLGRSGRHCLGGRSGAHQHGRGRRARDPLAGSPIQRASGLNQSSP